MNGGLVGVQRDPRVGGGRVKRRALRAHRCPGPEKPALRLPAAPALLPAGAPLAEMADAIGPAIQPPVAEAPIWFAALKAIDCQARTNGEDRAVLWSCVADRAIYTNYGADAEIIEPLGVRLQGGHTLAVSWLPGETAYRVEVLRPLEYVA
jgi:hypothetical protein